MLLLKLMLLCLLNRSKIVILQKTRPRNSGPNHPKSHKIHIAKLLMNYYQLVGCLEDMQSRVQTLEQALLSGEGGAIEEQITLTLVKKGK